LEFSELSEANFRLLAFRSQTSSNHYRDIAQVVDFKGYVLH